MNEREKPSFQPSEALAIQLQIHRLFEPALSTYATDPATYRCITAALIACKKAIEDCLEGETPSESGAGPTCPPGWEYDGRRCIPPWA